MGTEIGIGYQLNGSFYLKGENGNIIGFDIQFPSIYETKDDAEKCSEMLGLNFEKEEDSIVLCLYEGESAVQTLRWDEWWLYRCYKLKQEYRWKERLTSEDFEPYDESFENIFNRFVKSEYVVKYPLEHMQYWIEPIETINTLQNSKDDQLTKEEKESKHKKTLEEEFLTFTEEEDNMKFIGFLCEESVKIDDLADVLKFNKENYFKGKRFLGIKFEKEVLNYENLEFQNEDFVRFWKYPDGKYFKRVIGETGIHIGYQLKYIRFNVMQNVQKIQ
jgi:hypothetical protein